MKNLLLALVGLSFALGFTSGDEDSKRRTTNKQDFLAFRKRETSPSLVNAAFLVHDKVEKLYAIWK
jgi:hypothetical protein